MKNKAIFLDRDGTINVEKGYLYKKEEFEFIPGAIDALIMLQKAGYKLIIISNQSGIARGFYSEDDFHSLNNWMLSSLDENGIKIDAVYYCPHHPKAKIKKYRMDCSCRKPKPGLYLKAISEFDLDVNLCIAVGDKLRDCCICKTTGCRGYLISENEKKEIIEAVKEGNVRNVEYAKDLLEAASKILKTESV